MLNQSLHWNWFWWWKTTLFIIHNVDQSPKLWWVFIEIDSRNRILLSKPNYLSAIYYRSLSEMEKLEFHFTFLNLIIVSKKLKRVEWINLYVTYHNISSLLDGSQFSIFNLFSFRCSGFVSTILIVNSRKGLKKMYMRLV